MKEEKVIIDDLLELTLSDEFKVNNDKKGLFHSLNSKFLDSYDNLVIDGYKVPFSEENTDKTEKDNNQDFKKLIESSYNNNYKKILGSRFLHLGTLMESGFLNENYDITFCFDKEEIIQKANLIIDHDKLFEVLFRGKDPKVKELFKVKYSYGDEVLLRSLDLKQANHIITYSQKADNLISDNTLLNNIKRTNLSRFREKSRENYLI
jgi:hypothetical protein